MKNFKEHYNLVSEGRQKEFRPLWYMAWYPSERKVSIGALDVKSLHDWFIKLLRDTVDAFGKIDWVNPQLIRRRTHNGFAETLYSKNLEEIVNYILPQDPDVIPNHLKRVGLGGFERELNAAYRKVISDNQKKDLKNQGFENTDDLDAL